MSQFHFDPVTYLDKVHAEVPLYDTLEETIATATEGIDVTMVLDLGTGTGETLSRVLAVHPTARAIGIDELDQMLAAARQRLDGYEVELIVADLLDPLPPGPFDLVVSALAIHHLDGAGKAELFRRVAGALRPGGRFVLGDVVVPTDPSLVVTPVCDDYDKPSSLVEQLTWLRQAGLHPVVLMDEGDLVVVSADRPRH
jgi:tRNA (cmo5U34)-methyltransferase